MEEEEEEGDGDNKNNDGEGEEEEEVGASGDDTSWTGVFSGTVGVCIRH